MWGDNNNSYTYKKDMVGLEAYEHLQDFINYRLILTKEEINNLKETQKMKQKYDREKIIELIKEGVLPEDIQDKLGIDKQAMFNVMTSVYKQYSNVIKFEGKNKFLQLRDYLRGAKQPDSPKNLPESPKPLPEEKTKKTLLSYKRNLEAGLDEIYNFVGKHVLLKLEYDLPQARLEANKFIAQIDIIKQVLEEI